MVSCVAWPSYGIRQSTDCAGGLPIDGHVSERGRENCRRSDCHILPVIVALCGRDLPTEFPFTVPFQARRGSGAELSAVHIHSQAFEFRKCGRSSDIGYGHDSGAHPIGFLSIGTGHVPVFVEAPGGVESGESQVPAERNELAYLHNGVFEYGHQASEIRKHRAFPFFDDSETESPFHSLGNIHEKRFSRFHLESAEFFAGEPLPVEFGYIGLMGKHIHRAIIVGFQRKLHHSCRSGQCCRDSVFACGRIPTHIFHHSGEPRLALLYEHG